MDLKIVEILVNSDGSFSGKNNGSSQVVFIIYLTDQNHKASLINYSNIKSRIVVRSFLGTEAFDMADACDESIVLK